MRPVLLDTHLRPDPGQLACLIRSCQQDGGRYGSALRDLFVSECLTSAAWAFRCVSFRVSRGEIAVPDFLVSFPDGRLDLWDVRSRYPASRLRDLAEISASWPELHVTLWRRKNINDMPTWVRTRVGW